MSLDGGQPDERQEGQSGKQQEAALKAAGELLRVTEARSEIEAAQAAGHPDDSRHHANFFAEVVLFAFADYIMGTIWIIVVTPLTIRASALSKFLSGQTAMALIETAIYAAVWYSYLLKSERVRVTFLQDLPTG